MINVALYSENFPDYFINKIESYFGNVEYSYFTFKYSMDLLDYLNSARPNECVVFYECTDTSEGVNIALKVREINKNYRFNFICEKYGNVEELFYKGVTYYIGTQDVESGINRCFERVGDYYKTEEGNALVLTAKNGVYAIPFDSIDYIMSDKRKIIVFFGDEERTFYYKLDEIEPMLRDNFFRCHQSYIVNMNRIVRFETDGVVLDSEEFLPVSRKRYFAVKKQYLAFVSGNRDILFK